MVNRFNASKWGSVPSEEVLATDEGRRIAVRQLYSDGEVLALASKGASSIIQWTKGCQMDVSNLGWDSTDVAELVCHAVQYGKRLKPVWCVQAPTGPAAACDVFSVLRVEIGDDGVKRVMSYYLKLAISVSGKILLIVSCHTTEK